MKLLWARGASRVATAQRKGKTEGWRPGAPLDQGRAPDVWGGFAFVRRRFARRVRPSTGPRKCQMKLLILLSPFSLLLMFRLSKQRQRQRTFSSRSPSGNTFVFCDSDTNHCFVCTLDEKVLRNWKCPQSLAPRRAFRSPGDLLSMIYCCTPGRFWETDFLAFGPIDHHADLFTNKPGDINMKPSFTVV